MAWIESHQSLPTHRKTMRLKAALEIKTPQAMGHLHLLWLWALDNAPDGCLEDIPDEGIAEVCQWEGDASEFVNALMDAGFIDRDTCMIHDWEDYAGKLMARREANAQRTRDWRARHVTVTSPLRDGATVPNRTQPNRTQPNHVTEDKPQKHKHGEHQNVLLTDDEYQKLLGDWGEQETKRWIDILSEGMALKNYGYKSHNLALRTWRRRDNGQGRKAEASLPPVEGISIIGGPEEE